MLKEKLIALLFFIVVFVFPSAVFSAGATMDSSGRLILPALEYQGQTYYLELEMYANLSDPSNIYWKYSNLRFSSIKQSCGGALQSSLDIKDICVLFAGGEYKIDLQYYNHPDDKNGLYWRLIPEAFETINSEIVSVSGDMTSCFNIEETYPCFMDCGDDPECYMECLPGGPFMLSINVLNNGSSPIEFVFPSGTVFQPKDSSVQPMLIINDTPRTIKPGETKTLCLNTYCLDSVLSAPDLEHTYFRNVEGATSECLIEIMNACSGITLNSMQRQEIQDIVWNCTDNGAITTLDRAYLDNLQ